MTPENLQETVVKALKSNRFDPVLYVETAEEAGKKALEMIPEDAKVGMGGSTSLMQTGLLEVLRKRGNMTMDKPDIYLTSSNAITLDGKLVNTDMTGNRVSSMIFGPKQVIVIAGMNKVVKDLHAAMDRIKNVITPHMAKSSGVRTPCATEGKCSDCKSPMRLCSVTTIIEAKPRVTQLSIILTGEDMGLSWDPEWDRERIEKIQSVFNEKWAILIGARQQAK
ncbi:MAG: lactate utilization protein [Desulfobacteraceae bacterium]|nr:lactate utilization protein [Desulfobacteraceae bacterium]MBU4001603.1 lactate utilization protein [Pseudomonadota bacterium]MBU4053341.1 lactate utilization protein [Pseudomonadota bacterium]